VFKRLRLTILLAILIFCVLIIIASLLGLLSYGAETNRALL
jgi:hypothetical protein